jgi:hypothetical protein
VKTSTEQAFRQTVSGYSTIIPETSSIRITNGTAKPVLYPIWLITTKKEDKTYTFAINGQTGTLTCDIPWSRAKFFGRMFTLGGLVAAAGFLAVFALSATGVI